MAPTSTILVPNDDNMARDMSDVSRVTLPFLKTVTTTILAPMTTTAGLETRRMHLEPL